MTLTDLLTQGSMTLGIAVWSIFAGVVIASFIALYYKQVLGKFVSKLIESKAESPYSALTLEESGFSKKVFVRLALGKGGQLRRVVYAVTEIPGRPKDELGNELPFTPVEDIQAEDARNESLPSKTAKLNTLHFYIPKRFSFKAEELYCEGKGSIFMVLLAALIFVALAMLVMILVPYFTDLLKNLFS